MGCALEIVENYFLFRPKETSKEEGEGEGEAVGGGKKVHIAEDESPAFKINIAQRRAKGDTTQIVMIPKADLKKMLSFSVYRPLAPEMREQHKMSGSDLRNWIVTQTRNQGFLPEFIKSTQKVYERLALENYVSAVPCAPPREDEETSSPAIENTQEASEEKTRGVKESPRKVFTQASSPTSEFCETTPVWDEVQLREKREELRRAQVMLSERFSNTCEHCHDVGGRIVVGCWGTGMRWVVGSQDDPLPH